MKQSSELRASKRMKLVRRSGTHCEQLFELMLNDIGLVYEAQSHVCSCKPDFLLRGPRLAIFIDGDFWHGRIAVDHGFAKLRGSFRGPTRRFWIKKILRNIERDKRQTALLRRRGWSVLRIWEKDLLADPDATLTRMNRQLTRRRTMRSDVPPSGF
jgi:DNA mismatch endonuclease Vsr